jgi:hypothetical protein
MYEDSERESISELADHNFMIRVYTGIAPDGSTINSNPPFSKPPYSSKFELLINSKKSFGKYRSWFYRV